MGSMSYLYAGVPVTNQVKPKCLRHRRTSFPLWWEYRSGDPVPLPWAGWRPAANR